MTLATLFLVSLEHWKASSKSSNDFQIIGISETTLKKTQKTTTNIQFENYNIEHVPIESLYRHTCMQ